MKYEKSHFWAKLVTWSEPRSLITAALRALFFDMK